MVTTADWLISAALPSWPAPAATTTRPISSCRWRDDPEFADIMINPLTAPTYERHFFGGDATSFRSYRDAADRFNLGCVDNMSLFLRIANPIQPIRMVADPSGGRRSTCSMSPRASGTTSYTSTSGKDWQAMLAAAMEPQKGLEPPHLPGEGAMWRGIPGQALQGHADPASAKAAPSRCAPPTRDRRGKWTR